MLLLLERTPEADLVVLLANLISGMMGLMKYFLFFSFLFIYKQKSTLTIRVILKESSISYETLPSHTP